MPCLKKYVPTFVPKEDRLHMWFDQNRWVEYMEMGFDIPEVPALRMWEFIRKSKGTKKGKVRHKRIKQTLMYIPAFIVIRKFPKTLKTRSKSHAAAVAGGGGARGHDDGAGGIGGADGGAVVGGGADDEERDDFPRLGRDPEEEAAFVDADRR